MNWRRDFKMSIKIALLKSGETIISDAKELVLEDTPCGYLFSNPHKIKLEYDDGIFLTENKDSVESDVKVTFSSWIPLTSEDEIAIPKDWVVTIVEPLETIRKMYEEKINEQNNKVSNSQN
jgi:hypothetical protein